MVNNTTEIGAPFRVGIPRDAAGNASREMERSVSVRTDEASDAIESDRPRLVLLTNDFDALFQSVEEQWQDRALCAQTDPEAFFPEKGGSTREAKRICLGCEVRDECLEYALAHDERFGIWGGLSERERRRLKRGIS